MQCELCEGTGLQVNVARYEALACERCNGSGWIGKRPKPQEVVVDSKVVEPIKKGKK